MSDKTDETDETVTEPEKEKDNIKPIFGLD